MQLKKLLTLALILLFSSLVTSGSPALFTKAEAAEARYTISGYIIDQGGNGIPNAEIIFGVPDIVPAAFSDATGHYSMSAPAGTYHLNVWPPFDSNYIFYDQKGFAVNGDMTKNITLDLGCKVSGYILNSGAPVQGAVVALNEFYCGWYSNYSGYYFVTAPPATYTFSLHPRQGLTFPSYSENNLAVTQDLSKNVTLGSTSPTQRVKVSGYVLDQNGCGIAGANVIFNVPSIVPSVWTNQSGYYEMSAPAGTYHINVWPPFNSNYINYDESGFQVAASDINKNITMYLGYKVSGYIVDSQGVPVNGAAVLLDNYGSGWFSKADGYYFLNVPAGTYTLKVQPRVGTNFPSYYEYSFAVSCDIAKNITVGSAANSSTTSYAASTVSSSASIANPTQIPTPPTLLPATSVTNLVDTAQDTTEDTASTTASPDVTVWALVIVAVVLVVVGLALVAKKRM